MKSLSEILATTLVDDIHTHLYAPAFGDLLLYGIDELLTYHYLIAETARHLPGPIEEFWGLAKPAQADLVWEHLFVRHSPLSEATRGIVTTLQALGLDPKQRDLRLIRTWFEEQNREGHVDRCLKLASVGSVCMTNSPFDAQERAVWDNGFKGDPRFRTALRIDPLLLSWPEAAGQLVAQGYKVKVELSVAALREVRRFLEEWIDRMGAGFLMVSLPPEFDHPSDGPCSRLIEEAVLPVARERKLPFALMPGVRRGMNPALRMAGDGVGFSNLRPLARLCADNPQNKFMATVLARENQHELCVLARKFSNLHPFGCWWFLNTPSLIDEMTRMRLELLGSSFTPQHSDARVMEQLIYKWRHTREVLAVVLQEKYDTLARSGWIATESEIRRDVKLLLGGAFQQFLTGEE